MGDEAGPPSEPGGNDRRVRAALDNVVDAIVWTDEHLRIVDANAAALALAGAGTIGRGGFDLVHEDDRELAAERFAEVLTTHGERVSAELRVLVDGGSMWVEVNVTNRLDDPDIGALIFSFRDLTAERALSSSEAMFRTLVTAAPIGIVAGRTPWAADINNRRFAELMGRDDQRLGVHGWVDLLDDDARRRLDELGAGGQGNGTIDWRTAAGDVVRLNVTLLPDGGYIVAATDVTGIVAELQAERDAGAMWAYAATHDQVTGVANRSLGLDRLAMAIAGLRRVDRHLAVTFLDLDRFKAINDAYGHDVGDRVLRVVAERLTRGTRAEDTVARWGGDEFIVIAQVNEHDFTPEKLGARLQSEMAVSIPVGHDDRLLIPSCSMGMAVAGPDVATATGLITAADLAMYTAKRNRTGLEIVRISGADGPV